MNKLSIMTKGIVIAMNVVGIAYADNWTGFYAGVDAGLVFNNIQLTSQQLGFTSPGEHCDTNSNLATLTPGIQLGYMHQFPSNFVSGIETDITFNKHNNSIGCRCPHNPNVSDNFSLNNRNLVQNSIKARGGRAITWDKNILLPYLTAGASFANVGLSYSNEGGDYFLKNTSQSSLLLGAGIEWAFRQNWSLRAEYTYVDYGNIVRMPIPSIYGLEDPNGVARVNLNANTILMAINYWL